MKTKQFVTSIDKPTTSCGQITVDVAMSKGEKYPQSLKQWQQLTDSVTHCLAKDMMPIYSVDKPGFRRMLERFDPKYALPTHKYFSKVAIPSLCVRTRETVTSELSETWEGEYVNWFFLPKFVIVQLLNFVKLLW